MKTKEARIPRDWDTDVENLGDEIRQLRRANNLTLTELGDTIGKSAAFLSLIENNKTKPSIAALQEISEALGVHVGWFFQSDPEVDGEERKVVVRAANRRRISYSGMAETDYLGHYDHLLSANLDGDLVLGMSRYEPGGSTGDDHYSHQGEEAGIIFQGTIELTVSGETYALEEGDSFSFPSTEPHRYYNPGDTDAVIVWANTPITLRP